MSTDFWTQAVGSLLFRLAVISTDLKSELREVSICNTREEMKGMEMF